MYASGKEWMESTTLGTTYKVLHIKTLVPLRYSTIIISKHYIFPFNIIVRPAAAH